MNFEEAVHRLEMVDRKLAGFQLASQTTDPAELFKLHEDMNGIPAVLAGLQSYVKKGGTGSGLETVLASIRKHCQNLQPILENGAQYCAGRLSILSVPAHGYGPPGSALLLNMHGEIAEEG